MAPGKIRQRNREDLADEGLNERVPIILFPATEKIRQRKGLNERVPIIAVTANAMKGDRDKCIEAGMDDYISKPVDRKKLYEIIAKWTMVSYTPPPEGGAPENLGPAK
ncbi:hypothetical protein T484DRAFT_1802407, partial [Baffinella frigidus]